MCLPRMLSKQCFPFLMNRVLLPALGIMLYCLGRAERRAYSSSRRRHQLQPLHLCAAQVCSCGKQLSLLIPIIPAFCPHYMPKSSPPRIPGRFFPALHSWAHIVPSYSHTAGFALFKTFVLSESYTLLFTNSMQRLIQKSAAAHNTFRPLAVTALHEGNTLKRENLQSHFANHFPQTSKISTHHFALTSVSHSPNSELLHEAKENKTVIFHHSLSAIF